LKSDISNFENIILSICREDDPTSKFLDIVRMSLKTNDNFKFLPDISDDDYKSSLYIGKLIFNTNLKNYIEKSIKIKNSVPALKYKPETEDIDNLNLAYDLLLIMGYLKITKERLELKESDAQINKSITYLATRCFTDILYMSFLNLKNVDALKNIIMSRFKIYKENGFFKSFEDKTTSYGLALINYTDISIFVDSILSKILNNEEYLKLLHNKYYESRILKIPYVNKISLEQIINEAIKLEVDIKTIDNLDINKYLENVNNEEIKKYLLSNEVIKERKKRTDSNILRYVKFFDNEIPENEKEEFYRYIESLKVTDDVEYSKFNLSYFGDNIVKGIYEWNESPNREEIYTTYFSKCEQTINKRLILNKVGIEVKNEETSENEDWLSEI